MCVYVCGVCVCVWCVSGCGKKEGRRYDREGYDEEVCVRERETEESGWFIV